jgi:hypothetical protein
MSRGVSRDGKLNLKTATQLPLRTSVVFVVLCKCLWGREPATGFEPVTC